MMISQDTFIGTKGHRKFTEFCDACRKYKYIGLCYGSPGVGKSLSARTYARWDLFQPFMGQRVSSERAPLTEDAAENWAVMYTPAVGTTPRQLSDQLLNLRVTLDSLIKQVHNARKDAGWTNYKFDDRVDLIIVDEADRLQLNALEQLRDIFDRTNTGVVLIGMPGIEKRMSRYPQLYSRVGFVHEFRPLSTEEMHFILERKWQQLDLKFDRTDFTDSEAFSAIVRITEGNFRLVHRLFAQIERVMTINDLKTVTKEVVETARENLVIGN